MAKDFFFLFTIHKKSRMGLDCIFFKLDSWMDMREGTPGTKLQRKLKGIDCVEMVVELRVQFLRTHG